MVIKGITDEDFVNYKKPAMFIAFPTCSFKCCHDCGMDICQNSELVKATNIDISIESLCERYISNPITHSIVCGGLEPFDSKFDLISFVNCLRNKFNCNDDIVIYSGYYKNEIDEMLLEDLKKYPNIIIKWGRFIPDQKEHKDEILGVTLMSNNQFAERLS